MGLIISKNDYERKQCLPMRPKLEGKCLSKITLFSHGSSVMTPVVQENKSKTCENPKMIWTVLEKHEFIPAYWINVWRKKYCDC